jgi:hypothetical protein
MAERAAGRIRTMEVEVGVQIKGDGRGKREGARGTKGDGIDNVDKNRTEARKYVKCLLALFSKSILVASGDLLLCSSRRGQ